MHQAQISNDQFLKQRLSSLSVDNEEYWSFKGQSNREYCHGIFQYPAMMVPQLVRAMLDELLCVNEDIQTIGDPYSGSGTVLTESLLKGKHFWGVDINPLAILLCKVKQGPFYIDELRCKIDKLASAIQDLSNEVDEVEFHNIDKWFRDDVKESLTRIRGCIRNEPELWARRFFWVVLAETVRLTSNSRTSTFKLHIRTEDDINSRQNDVVSIFFETIERNFVLYKNQFEALHSLNLLDGKHYKKKVDISLANIINVNAESKCDLIITSPPYGDNATTVPYGQYSYLPLQWIDLDDIIDEMEYDPLATTHSIDFESLGGSRRITDSEVKAFCNLSGALSIYVHKIQSQPKERIRRVTSFVRDLCNSLPSILNALKLDGIMVWILGNRTVGGHEVPLDDILIDLLQVHGAKHICTLSRTIPTKRMAPKNNRSNTMSKERIVVMRKV